MSRPYGPIPLTAGVAASVDIDSSATWALIENSSIFLTVGVSFQVNKPPVVPVFSGAPYSGAIQAGGTKLFKLPVNDGTWTGRVWMLPLSQATLSAATGATSSIQSALITTFAEGEDPVNAQGVLRGLDLTSQPRIIDVPMAASTTLWNTSTPSIFTLPSDVLAVNPANVVNLNLFNVGWAAGSVKNISIYTHLAEASALTTGSCVFTIYAWPVDAGGNFITNFPFGVWPIDVWRAGQFGPAGGTSLPLPTPNVFTHQNVPGISALIAGFKIGVLLTSGNGGMQVLLRLDFSADIVDGGFIGGVGQHTNFPGDLY